LNNTPDNKSFTLPTFSKIKGFRTNRTNNQGFAACIPNGTTAANENLFVVAFRGSVGSMTSSNWAMNFDLVSKHVTGTHSDDPELGP